MNTGWLAFNGTVQELERLLHTEYHEYEHTETGHIVPACDAYVISRLFVTFEYLSC
jgi:tripeptidyl-peptidase I